MQTQKQRPQHSGSSQLTTTPSWWTPPAQKQPRNMSGSVSVSTQAKTDLCASRKSSGSEMTNTPNCLHCGQTAERALGASIYPRSPHLKDHKFWRCKPCGAHVGCHPPIHKNGYKEWLPLGRPANNATRRARSQVHAVLDPIWKAGKTRKQRAMLRSEVYLYLGTRMKLTRKQTHVGLFTYNQCYEALRILRGRSPEEIRIICETEIMQRKRRHRHKHRT